MLALTDACIRKPVLAWMLMAGVVAFGLVAYYRIGVSQFPNVDQPIISVDATWDGATAEVIENDVVQVLEDAVRQVEGVTALSSTARSGSARVRVEFQVGRSIDAAMQEVQNKISQAARQLPKDLDPPIVSKSNTEENPILIVNLAGTASRQSLADTARYRVKERLQSIPGVGDIMVAGYLEPNLRLWFDPDALEERNLTVNEVVGALRSQHLELPAGRIEPLGRPGREVDVRVMGEAASVTELRSLVVGGDRERPVRLGDVALVEEGFADARTLARANGQTAIAMIIRKQIGANQVEVVRALRQEIGRIAGELPDSMKLDIAFDPSVFIERSITDMREEILIAALLTALVCWIFLGSFSATLNVVLAIPMSIMGTVAVLYWCGFTLNTFTLLALALVIGLVVDDAIMVQENITRWAENGHKPREAASKGTREIAFAALAATVAMIAVFSPVVFMPGVMGVFFLQFGVALTVALAISYLEAMTIAPSRCAQFVEVGRERGLMGRVADAGFVALGSVYRRVLGFAVRRPWTTLGLALLVMAICILSATRVRMEFVPSEDQSRLIIRADLPAGANLHETERAMALCEDQVLALPEVQRVFAMVGGFGGAGGVNSMFMFVVLTDKGQRSRGHLAVLDDLDRRLNGIPGLTVRVEDPSQQSFTGQRGGFRTEFSLRGSDWDALVRTQQELRERIQAMPGVRSVDTSYRLGRPEVGVTVDREAARDLGVPTEQVAQAINYLLGSVKVGKFTVGTRRVDIRSRALAPERLRPEDLDRFRVRAASGTLVPLANLVHWEEHPALQSVTRLDGMRAINVYLNEASGASQAEVRSRVAQLCRETMPPGISFRWEGVSAQGDEARLGLIFAFFFGILVAYMVLGGQFNSFLDPVTVLSVLAPALLGAFIGLWLFDVTLNIASGIGLLLLMGIAKKNSIILVDYANQAKEAGKDAVEAMLQAGPIRLRPILMTSAATMMAAVPIAIGLGAGAETRQPMAVAILGGVALSTLLSLVIVPAVYVLVDRFRGFFRRRQPG